MRMLLIALLITACGKEVAQSMNPSASCLSANVYFLDNLTFLSNDKGVFVPEGWTSSQEPDDCGEVRDSVLTAGDRIIRVVNGVPSIRQ